MFVDLLLAAAFQIGPFYEQQNDRFTAARPFYSQTAEGKTDVLWPLFTSHRDWWRFCLISHYQEQQDGGYQFEIMPIWFNGRTGTRDGAEGESYWGFFPFYGHHPHIALMYDVDFAIWPLWMSYSMPRSSEERMMRTNAVLFPFFHWRDDGSWGFWPVYGVNHRRESDHRYALWPLFTWASYREDRDTAGAGNSWMVWPVCGGVTREREDQWMFLPPFFSFAEVRSKVQLKRGNSAPDVRIRAPWPFIDCEFTASHEHWGFWPIWERDITKAYADGQITSRVDRFGWKLVELYDSETRVFPFWVSRPDDTYFRLWPLWETSTDGEVKQSRFLSLMPIRWSEGIERNWAKFWTLYEDRENPVFTEHSLFWGLIRWRTYK